MREELLCVSDRERARARARARAGESKRGAQACIGVDCGQRASRSRLIANVLGQHDKDDEKRKQKQKQKQK